jgi:hypothetical protein
MNLACVACFDKFFVEEIKPHKCWLDTVANCTFIVFAELSNIYPCHWLPNLQSTGSWAQSKWRLAPGLGISSTLKSVFFRFYKRYHSTLHQLFEEYPIGSTSCGREESTIMLFFAVFRTRAVSRAGTTRSRESTIILCVSYHMRRAGTTRSRERTVFFGYFRASVPYSFGYSHE